MACRLSRIHTHRRRMECRHQALEARLRSTSHHRSTWAMGLAWPPLLPQWIRELRRGLLPPQTHDCSRCQ